jgi:O-antigen/teichoic acid export membrane protein
MSIAAIRSALAGIDRRVADRAAVVIGAYTITALALVATVAVLRFRASPLELRATLGFFFISSMAAGLDPATAKAAALSRDGALERPAASYLIAGALKAAVAAPLLAVVWKVSDPQISWAVLAWLPLVCAAGFWTTDLRVLLDLNGRHAAAIGLKQGALSGGYMIAGLLVAAGAGLPAAVAGSTVARAAVALAAAPLVGRGRPTGDGEVWRQTRALLADVRWVEFAATSVLGAASGSADRVIGLRILAPAAYGAYYITYETLSRFWVIPFLFAPIIYARSVGTDRGGRRVAQAAWLITAVAGVGMVAGLAFIFAAFPRLIPSLTGADLRAPSLVLAIAVVISAFAQIRLTELQAAGRARVTLAIVGVMSVISPVAFFLGAHTAGAAGLMWAWLLKSALELALLLAVGSPRTAAVRAA